MPFYLMEKFWDFFTLRHSDLNTTLNYVLMDNLCSCFIEKLQILLNLNLEKYLNLKKYWHKPLNLYS